MKIYTFLGSLILLSSCSTTKNTVLEETAPNDALSQTRSNFKTEIKPKAAGYQPDQPIRADDHLSSQGKWKKVWAAE